jgi:hypothetical protein
MWLTSLGGSINPVITNNTITGGTVTQQTNGYNLWNNSTTATNGITINGGSVSDVGYGVWINNWEGFPTSGGSNASSTKALIQNVSINNASTAGIYIHDNPLNTNGASAFVNATILNNFISNTGVGILVAGVDAYATANDNSITPTTSFAINNTSPNTIVATCNWYGLPCFNEVSAKISGLVTFNPILVSGTDDGNPSNGFQPAGACETLVALSSSITGNITLCEAGPMATSVLTGSAVGGEGTKTFSWSNSHPSVVSLSNSGIFNPTVSALSDGTSTLTLTVTDEYGCTDTESVIFTVTNTQEAPTYTIGTPMNFGIEGNYCGTPINLTTDPMECTSSRTVLKPVWMDNCSVTASMTVSGVIVEVDDIQDNGTYLEVLFGKGQSVINFIGTDAAGNVTTCTLTVNVDDEENPEINGMPSDTIINVPTGNCSQVITWIAPTPSDNCPGVMLTSNINPGTVISAVPGMSTQVIKVVYTATDAVMNMKKDSFYITLNFNCIPEVELSMQMPSFTPGSQAVATAGEIDGVFTVKNLSTTNATHELTPQGNVQVLIALPASNIFSTSGAELNTDWDITYYPALPEVPTGMLLFTLKTGISIPPLGIKTITLKYTATGTSGQTARTTGNLIKGSGGDVDKSNNNTLGNFSIN